MVLLLHAQLLNLLSDGHLEPGCVCVVPIRPNGRGFLMFLVAQGVVPRRQPGPFSKLREKKTGFRGRDTGGLGRLGAVARWLVSIHRPRVLWGNTFNGDQTKNNKCGEKATNIPIPPS